MGPPSYMRSVVERNVVMRSIPVITNTIYHSFATRVSQLKIWHFFELLVIQRNVCRCTFNRYSVITQFAKLAAGERLRRRCTHRKL